MRVIYNTCYANPCVKIAQKLQKGKGLVCLIYIKLLV